MTVRFPLRHHGAPDGVLAFRFHTKEESDAARDRLVRFAAIIQTVWEAQWTPRSYRETMEGIIDMEMKLSDSKIDLPTLPARWLKEAVKEGTTP